jgi:hypothetical protein
MLKKLFSILMLSSCCSSLVSAQVITADFTTQLAGGNNTLLYEIGGSSYNWGNLINGSYAYDDAVSVYSRSLFDYVTPISTFTISFPNATYSFDLNNVNGNSLYSNGTYMGAFFYRNSYGLNLFAPLSLDSYNALSGYTTALSWMVAFQPDGSGFTESSGAFVSYTNYQETVRAVPIPSSIIFFVSALLFLFIMARNYGILDSKFSQITV